MRRRIRLIQVVLGFSCSIFLFNISVEIAGADWPDDPTVNVPIPPTAPASQALPQLISDGAGGAIVTLLGSDSLYLQRVDASGTPVWSGGVLVSTTPGISQLISDGAGGAIITWFDRRNDSGDIYAQRVNANGKRLWSGANGVPVCVVPNNQWDSQLVSDGAGGAIVTWEDYRDDPRNIFADIYAQRVDASGAALWTTDGIPISTAASTQTDPQLISDGIGGAIITWLDARVFREPNIYAQRVDGSGTVQWDTDGIEISKHRRTQADPQAANPQLVSGGAGGAIITWWGGTGGFDILAQQVDANGTLLWATPGAGVPVSTRPGFKLIPQLVSDGAGGAIITWFDRRSDPLSDIYAQRIDTGGRVQWLSNGVPICVLPDNQRDPQLVSDGAGGAIITWKDRRSGINDIYAQRVDGSGTVQWDVNGAPVSTAIGEQRNPQLISDGAGGAIVTWWDTRNDSGDIYAQNVNPDGTLGGISGGGQVAQGFILPVIDDNPTDHLMWGVPFNYFGHYFSSQGGHHPAEDWNLVSGDDLGQTIYAIANGTVEIVSDLTDSGRGYLVAIKHTGNFTISDGSGTEIESKQSYSYNKETGVDTIYSIYLHIKPADGIKADISVNQRQPIGTLIELSGSQPHLHFEIRHPKTKHSNDWSLFGIPSNWAKSPSTGKFSGYYLDLQKMVDAITLISPEEEEGGTIGGVRDPREFIAANSNLNTPLGTNVVVQPVDAATGEAPVVLSFSEITQVGTTNLETSDSGPPPQSNFKLGNPIIYYEVTTTANFNGSVGVCINYRGTSFDNESKLNLFHFENGVWVDITSLPSPYTGTDVICGSVTSLSSFAIFEEVILVDIDIKPDDDTNSINLKSKGVISVAVLSTENFDATTVDGSSVRFGPSEVIPKHGDGHLEDVDNDGDTDWLGHFTTQDAGFGGDETEASITGKTKDGQEFAGTDSVTIVGGSGKAPSVIVIAVPKKTRVLSVFPNPANPEVWIPYHLSSGSRVIISIYDLRGRLVREFDLGFKAAGFYDSKVKAAYWDGYNVQGEKVSSGIYFYKFQAGEFTATRKLLILR